VPVEQDDKEPTPVPVEQDDKEPTPVPVEQDDKEPTINILFLNSLKPEKALEFYEEMIKKKSVINISI
jgi:pentatricopeptide repeat protein